VQEHKLLTYSAGAVLAAGALGTEYAVLGKVELKPPMIHCNLSDFGTLGIGPDLTIDHGDVSGGLEVGLDIKTPNPHLKFVFNLDENMDSSGDYSTGVSTGLLWTPAKNNSIFLKSQWNESWNSSPLNKPPSIVIKAGWNFKF
jgi:hypothetical protein